MGFDPDKYIQKNAPAMSGGFDPDAYLSQQKPKEKVGDNSGAAQTALEQFGNTAGMGYLPHAQALVEKPMFSLLNLVTGNDVKPDDYIEARDKNIARQEQMAKDNPKAAAAGNVAGFASSLLLPAGAAAKGASALSKIGNAAKVGAMYGAAMNPGDTEGELSPLQLGDRGKNAGIGAILGGGTAALVEGGAKVADWASKKLAKNAEEKAFKALGPYQRDTVKAAAKDGQMQSVGRSVLDSGILNGAPSWEKVGERAKVAADTKGSQLENIVDDIARRADEIDPGSKALALPGQSGGATSGIDRKAVADAVRADLVSSHTDIPGIKNANAKIEALISEFENGGDRFIKVKNNEELKKAIGKQINWNRLPGADIPLEEQVLRSLYNKVKTGSEDAADYLSKKLGDETATTFRGAKKEYGNLKQAAEIASKRAAKEKANRILSPSDYGVGIGGALFGASQGNDPTDKLKNAGMGLLAGLAHKAVRTRGNSFMANRYDAASKLASNIGSKISGANVSSLIPALANVASKRENVKAEEFDPQMLNILVENPDLIDSFEDPKIRAKLTEKLNQMRRNPSSK